MSALRQTEVMVIGGGPAGLSAAVEAASLGCRVLVVDSDLKLGGQLIKQTHKFFGSKEEHAGTRRGSRKRVRRWWRVAWRV